MRPWTTRTMRVAVVAAGFAAAGTGTASAAGTSAGPTADLPHVPDQIGFQTPVNTCQTPPGLEQDREKMPCADVTLTASSPNLFKKVGGDVARTSHGLAGELRDNKPLLSPGKPNRILGHVANEAAQVERMTKLRPTLGVAADPGHTGVLDEHTPQGGLLDAQVGPREPGHQGLSALDTKADISAARGFQVAPLVNPIGLVTPALQDNPLQTSPRPLTLPKPEQTVPALEQLPVNGVSSAVKATAHNVATGMPQLPVGDVSELPVVNSLGGSAL